MGPRDKAVPPTSQQIHTQNSEANEEPSDTVSHFYFYFFPIHRKALLSARGNVRQIGRMFSEHVEWSFLDPEYSFIAVQWILPTRFTKKNLPNSEPARFTEYSEVGSQTNMHPIKNRLNTQLKLY